MKKRGILLAAALCGALCFARPALAEVGEIAVGGEFLMRIRVGSAGFSVKERADIVTERLTPILAQATIRPADVKVVPIGGNNYKLMVKDRLLITVTPEDGRANGVSARQQGRIWAKRLREELPRINVKPNPNAQDG